MNRSVNILAIDDEPATLEALATVLDTWGYGVVAAASGREAVQALEREVPDLVLTDLVMPGVSGLEVLRKIKAEKLDVPVIILTGQGTVDGAVEAIRAGAYHFIQKPLDPAMLKLTVQGALEISKKMRRQENDWRRREREAGGGAFIGQSRAMREVFQLIDKVAPSKASVVVTGQSGTGKEMVARAIHQASSRRDKPFIAINCSAIPPTLLESEIFGFERGAFTGAEARRLGVFELADQGTLFLDEIGEIQPELQAKFLRVLEEERVRRLGAKSEVTVDVRVIAATNRDLKGQIRTGQFREDLFFRLNVFHIPLPPLRDRPEDIPPLVDHFVDKFARDAGKKVRVAPQARQRLANYPWPGNIRELRNCLERAVLLCDEQITERDLPAELIERGGEASIRLPLGLGLREIDRAYIEANLSRFSGNKSKTAQALGISEKTLYNKLHRYAEQDERNAGGDESHEASAAAE